MKTRTRQLVPRERRVDLENFETTSELRPDSDLLSQYAHRGKSESIDQIQYQTHSPQTEATLHRLLSQVDNLLVDFRCRRDLPGPSIALQGLALLGQDLLDFVRENIACPLEFNTASGSGSSSLEVIP